MLSWHNLLSYYEEHTDVHDNVTITEWGGGRYEKNPNYEGEKDEVHPEYLMVGYDKTVTNNKGESTTVIWSTTIDSYNEYDFIVGNPPYLNKASTYVRLNREKLNKIYGKINAHETYAMFIVNSIWRLKEGGKLGFITSDSFLTLSTHKKLRKFILNNCKINEILLAPKK